MRKESLDQKTECLSLNVENVKKAGGRFALASIL